MLGGGVACGVTLGDFREEVPERTKMWVFVLRPAGRLWAPWGLWVAPLRSVFSAALVLMLTMEGHSLLASGAVAIPGRMGLVAGGAADMLMSTVICIMVLAAAAATDLPPAPAGFG